MLLYFCVRRSFCADVVGELPAGVTLVSRLAGSVDMVHLFATEAVGLAGKLRSARQPIAPDGIVWVSWPKKSSALATDLSDIVVRETALTPSTTPAPA